MAFIRACLLSFQKYFLTAEGYQKVKDIWEGSSEQVVLEEIEDPDELESNKIVIDMDWFKYNPRYTYVQISLASIA